MTAAIQTKQIQLSRGHFSLSDITLLIPDGKLTAIVGPNGSGKSTLLQVITRLIPADHGEVFVQQKSVNSYKRNEFARTLSMLPQSKGTLPDLTVREIVSYGRSPYKSLLNHRMTSDDNHIIDWALNVTGTKRHEERLFHTLSGGEQQKIRIAMALAQRTNILLLDEPTTFLDIAHQLDVMEMLQMLNREYGMTIVMVLHDLQQAAAYCNHLIAMKQGKVAITGNPQDIVTTDFLRNVYEIDAKVKFDDGYPLIIPIKTKS